MTYEYRCKNCGIVYLNRYGVRVCPHCGNSLRRVYSILSTFMRRGWTDIPPESRYENWTPEEKAVARERGG